MKTNKNWEKSFDEKVKELDNANEQSEEPIDFGYKYVAHADGYKTIVATVTDWGYVKSFIKAQIDKAYKKGYDSAVEELTTNALNKTQPDYMFFGQARSKLSKEKV